MTAQDAPQRQIQATQGAVQAQGIDGVVGTAGVEAAARPQQGADQVLVDADEADEESADEAPSRRQI